MSLTPAFLDELRARTSLSGLIGKRVKLQRVGREHKGCCPFHDEKTPSFYVNDDKQFAHCFGCGWHGDAIRYLTESDGLTFIEAVRQLAGAAGMAMPERSPEAAARARTIEGIRPALEAVQQLYAAQLEQHGQAREYLAARGIGPAMIERYGLGWAPGDGGLRAVPGLTADAALAAGLIWRDDDAQGGRGRSGATFRARIMIPVHDAAGRIVGFAGRVLDGTEPKYKNSPASEIFDKGALLFNLHRAAARLQAWRVPDGGEAAGSAPMPDSLKRRLLIVEGQIDALMADDAGMAAVAPMGTALTERQLARAWRLVQAPVLLFDGDAAGRKAALRACAMALPQLAPDRTLSIALLADGADPADLLADAAQRQKGVNALAYAVAMARPISAFIVDAVLAPVTEAIERRQLSGDAAASGGGTALSPEMLAGLWDHLAEMASAMGHEALRGQFLALWRRRYAEISEIAGWAMSQQAIATTPRGEATPDKAARDSARVFAAADDEGARRLMTIIERRLRLRAEIAALRADDRDMATMAKALGYDSKAMSAVIRDIEADRDGREAGRHAHEALWSLYRQVARVRGPIDEAILPNPVGERDRKVMTSAAARRLSRLDAMLDAPAAVRSPALLTGPGVLEGR